MCGFEPQRLPKPGRLEKDGRLVHLHTYHVDQNMTHGTVIGAGISGVGLPWPPLCQVLVRTEVLLAVLLMLVSAGSHWRYPVGCAR